MIVAEDIRYVGVDDRTDEEAGDADLNIAPSTKFEDLLEGFVCPLCFVGIELFSEVDA